MSHLTGCAKAFRMGCQPQPVHAGQVDFRATDGYGWQPPVTDTIQENMTRMHRETD